MNQWKNAVVIVALAAAGMISGCGGESNATKPADAKSAPAAAATLPAGLFVEEDLPAGRSVGELKADANATGEVVVHGRIGGRVEPFVNGAAVFLLADANMATCNESHEEACPTPWDYCCEPRDSLMGNVATIQIVDANGKPLRLDLAGQHGLSPLAELTIVGDVAQRDGGALVINARKIHVKPNAG